MDQISTKPPDTLQRTEARLAIAGAVLSAIIVATILFGLARESALLTQFRNPWLAVHVASAVPALILGTLLLSRTKGDRSHRRLGMACAALLLMAAVASLGLHGLMNGPSPIHLLSILVIISVPKAVFAARRGQVEQHRLIIGQTYLGLLFAGLLAFAPGRIFSDVLFGSWP